MITGYASVFYNGQDDTEYRLGDRFVERIMPGAFDKSLARGEEVVGLFNHDPSWLLGRRSAGTLRLSTDDRGLHYEIDESDTHASREVVAHQRLGNLLGSSFGFVVEEESHVRDGDLVIRQIEQVSLRDVGPVTFPAYDGTSDVRMVDCEGRCMHLPDAVAAEVRSRMQRNASVRARMAAIRLDEQTLEGL